MKLDNSGRGREENQIWTQAASHRGRRTGLPRPVLLLTCCLTLATAYALLGAAAAFTDLPAPTQSNGDIPSTAAATTLVQRFYSTVNEVLLTGDVAPLAAVIAPGLVEHPGRAGVSGAEGLARTLLAERTTWPGFRIVVDDIRATGPDAVTAWVHPEAPNPPAVIGFAVPAVPSAWGPIEVLRIADGRIAERWASGSDALLLEPLGQLLPIDLEAHTVVKVKLHTVQPGATDELLGGAGAGSRLLYVQSGTVSVALDQLPRATPVSLDLWDVLAVAATTGATVTNTGPEPALILVAMSMPPPSNQEMAYYQQQSRAKPVGAVVVLAFLPVPKTGQMTLQRVMLEPGVTLTRGADVGETMILVERGTSWLTPDNGRDVQVRTSDGNLHPRAPEEALEPGDLVHVGAGLAGSWRAGTDEPVALLVLST